MQVLVSAAIEKVDEAIRCHERGVPADLSVSMLQTIRSELERMSLAQDPTSFRPGYGRFLLEWQDEHGLVKQLMEVEYQYERMK